MHRFLIIFAVFAALACSVGAQTKIELDGNRLKLPEKIRFVVDTDKLAPESLESLRLVKNFLSEKKSITTLRVEAHAKANGEQKGAQTLSEKRALAVARRLVENEVECERLLPVGFGATKPVAIPPDSAENERVEFHIAALRNRAVGGLPLDGNGKTAGDVCPAKK